MAWTVGDYARLGLSIAMIFAAVSYIEHRRATGKAMPENASFRAVFQTIGAGILLAVILSGVIYVWTGSAEHALSLGGILIGVVLLGGLRGMFSEYQFTRSRAKTRDKRV